MNNTILLESPKRKMLKMSVPLIAVILVAFIVALVTASQIGKNNLDGTYNTTVCTLEKLESEDWINTKVSLNGNETTLNFSTIVNYLTGTDKFADEQAVEQYLSTLIGKQIKVDTPTHLFEQDNVWVLGLTVDDEVVVDASDNIAQRQKENKVLTDVLTIVVVLLGVVCCGLIIWTVNTPKLQQYSLTEKYAEWFAYTQPIGKLSKAHKIINIVISVIFFALSVTFIVVAFTTKNDKLSDELGIWFFAITALFLLGVVLQLPLIRKKTIDFYDKNFPFDLTDLSHMNLPKNIKTQLQENAIAFRKANPDLFNDGGNDFLVNFTADGVDLYETNYDEEGSPFTNDEKELDIKSEIDGRSPTIKLTYEQCNFEAVPIFNKQKRPLIVLIKSRLQKSFDLPDEIQNDIHIVLGKDLLTTLNKYNVFVEGLDEILANKHNLMTNKKLQKAYNNKNGIH